MFSDKEEIILGLFQLSFRDKVNKEYAPILNYISSTDSPL